MEFLITYGWAILIAVGVIAGIAYFADIDASEALPEECDLGGNLYCKDFVVDEASNDVFLDITNLKGHNVLIDQITATTRDGELVCNILTPTSTLVENGETELFHLDNCGSLANYGEQRVLFDLKVDWRSETSLGASVPDDFVHVATGTMLANVRPVGVAPPPDPDPPVITVIGPMGTLGAGTTTATLSVSTDELATCRFNQDSDIPYPSMLNTFIHMGGNVFEFDVAVSDGVTYNYYVRCRDASNNMNPTGELITFDVALPPDTDPPVRSDGLPSVPQPPGTTDVNIALTTDENAICKWDPVPGISFVLMANNFDTTGGTAHSTLVSGFNDGDMIDHHVRCEDGAGNSNPDDFTITVEIELSDSTPPVLGDLLPTGTLAAGTTSTPISVTTNEAATCKWDTDGGEAFAAMANTFSTTGGTSHSDTYNPPLQNGQAYTIYVRCEDGSGNANPADALISFDVDVSTFTTHRLYCNTEADQRYTYYPYRTYFECRGYVGLAASNTVNDAVFCAALNVTEGSPTDTITITAIDEVINVDSDNMATLEGTAKGPVISTSGWSTPGYECVDITNVLNHWRVTKGDSSNVYFSIEATPFGGSSNAVAGSTHRWRIGEQSSSSPRVRKTINSTTVDNPWYIQINDASEAQTTAVTELYLINADTDLPISGYDPMSATETVDLAMYPNLNIQAVTSGSVESVVFETQHVLTRIEDSAPYAYAGDASGNYHVWTPAVGTYNIVATPFDLDGAGGNAGVPQQVTLNVISTSTSKAFQFDGSGDYLDISSLATPASFTYEAWINPSAADGNIIEERINTGDRAMYVEGNQLELGFWRSSARTVKGGTITQGIWQHVAGTWDGTTLRVYINGNEVNSNAPGTTPGTGAAQWAAIGRADTGSGWGGGLDSDFTGFIDEVRVYDRALSQPELAANHAAGVNDFGCDTTDLVAGYHLDGTGSTVVDYSGNGIDGSIVGATRSSGYITKTTCP